MKVLMPGPLSKCTRGFTIVELLITIAIIAILASIAFFSYKTAKTGADDKAREADVTTIMNALEKYYEKNGEYPADDAFNTTNSPTTLPNFTAVKALLPSLDDDALTGPGGYRFYAGCLDTQCSNTSNTWRDYMTKSYRYQSRDTPGSSPGNAFPKSITASYGSNTGWGCTITTYYDQPGYAIAWYSESKKIWIFKKSLRGKVDIAPYSSGPVAPQTCTFS
jgi:prepilin-type N-terminal cleavage/methylation domain-containing protein